MVSVQSADLDPICHVYGLECWVVRVVSNEYFVFSVWLLGFWVKTLGSLGESLKTLNPTS